MKTLHSVFVLLASSCVFALAAYSNATQGKPLIKPEMLRCEHRANPLNVDAAAPRLSWIVESDERNQVQTAYEILVASSSELLSKGQGDVWESGRVTSDETSDILYAGKSLASRQSCYWKVRVWDKQGNVSSFSEPAFWRMGLLSGTDWKGEWIGLKADTGTLKPATYVRKEFLAAKKVERAFLYATARGAFIASLNGKRIGNDILSPEWSDYYKRIQYFTYDVTPLIDNGTNCFAAILGDGFWRSYVGYGMKNNNYGRETSILIQLHIEYSDGTESVVATDGTWKASSGPIEYSDIQMGEKYDARKELGSWDRPVFSDTSWVRADVLPPPNVALVPLRTEPVRVTSTLPARSINKMGTDTCIVDFGQNIAGFCKLSVKGPSGQTITLRHGEVLNPDGSLYTTNLRSAKATDTYILSGKEKETFEPHFTFHGFRYVEVTGYPGPLTSNAIEACAINTALPVTGTFTCSDSLVNRLQQNIVWSQKDNFISIPTDCPQRDERLGWMGDAQIFVRTASFNMDINSFMEKWMWDVDDSQSPDGGFMDTSPAIKGMVSVGAPGWGDAGIIIPWTVYLCYGDKKIISDHFNAMDRWMKYIGEKNPDFVRRNRLNNSYGDWLSINAPTPKDLLATAFWASDAALMSKMAKAIGHNDESQQYKTLFDSVKAAFQRTYVSPEGRVQGNTQSCYVLALAMDLLPESQRDRAATYLIDDLLAKEGHLSTGFLGVKYLNPVLTETGHLDVAYGLLMNRTFPSWLFPVMNGATTIWERWDGWTKEKGFQDPGMNSFNHYSMGSVGEWLYRYVAGIEADPANPGFKHILIQPHPGDDLKFADGEYLSVRGTIESHWKVDGSSFAMSVTIPANTTATVYLPTSDVASVREGNRPVGGVADIRYVRSGKGLAVYEISSGRYNFTCAK